MRVQRIKRLVFLMERIVIAPGPDCRIIEGMEGVLDALLGRFELRLVSQYPREKTADIVTTSALSRWFGDSAVYPLPDNDAGHKAMLQSLVDMGAIIPGSSLWIDYHPIRTMIAMRQGIDTSIFVDSRRLYRDLWLWGIVPVDQF